MWASNICIIDISTYREYEDDIKDPYIINKILGINYPQQGARITPTSAPSNGSVGNGEEGMREWGDRWEFDCRTLKLKIKILH